MKYQIEVKNSRTGFEDLKTFTTQKEAVKAFKAINPGNCVSVELTRVEKNFRGERTTYVFRQFKDESNKNIEKFVKVGGYCQ